MPPQYIFTMRDLRMVVPPKREILRGINLAFFPGAKIGVLGANGAGKSTLLRTVFGMVRARGGSIRFDGREIAGRPPVDILKSGIAYVPQGRCNFPAMTVGENLEMGAYTRTDAGHGDRKRIVDV